jgi:type IV secretory pathway VirB2 component (pilin)
MPDDQAWRLAAALTLAVAFGWHWATHSRAQRDLEGVRAALERAQRAARTAAFQFAAVVAIVVIVARVYINHHGG